jgi:CheY-like chemotaxis protein
MSQRILVIDDNAATRETLSENLLANGYDTTIADSAAHGLAVALQEHPSLILLDYHMPRETGLEMLEKLRQDEWGKTAQVIFLTNDDEVDTVNGAMKFGVQDYILKTEMTTDLLLRVVAEKLQ